MKNVRILKSETRNYCLNESLRNGNFRNCWSVTRSSNSSVSWIQTPSWNGNWIRMRSVSFRNCWSVTRSSSVSWIRMKSWNGSSRKRKRVRRKKNLRSFPSFPAPAPDAETILRCFLELELGAGSSLPKSLALELGVVRIRCTSFLAIELDVGLEPGAGNHLPRSKSSRASSRCCNPTNFLPGLRSHSTISFRFFLHFLPLSFLGCHL